MKSTELRIGNLAQDNKGNLLRVAGLTEDNISYYIIDRSKFPLQEDWKAEPIPLTEEWLIKLGFNESDDGNSYVLELDRRWAYLVLEEDFSMSIYDKEDLSGVNNPCFKEGISKHVHQLQNLYFALTNEELTIENK